MTPTAFRPCFACTSRNVAAIVSSACGQLTGVNRPCCPVALSSGWRARPSARDRVVLGEALRAEHAAVHRVGRIAADAHRASVLDPDEHAAADRAVPARRRDPAVGRFCADTKPATGSTVYAYRSACVSRPSSRRTSCGLAPDLQVWRRQVLRDDADEEQVAAEDLAGERQHEARAHHAAAPAATSGSTMPPRASRIAAHDEVRLERRRQQARRALQFDAAPRRSAARSARRRAPVARRPWRRRRARASARRSSPSAAASSGPRAAAVRLNCTGVNGVFQAGRDGTR